MGDAAKTMDAGGMVLLTQEQVKALMVAAVQEANANGAGAYVYLDPAGVGKWLGVDEKTVRGWIAHDGLVAYKLGARLFRLKRSDVIEWIESQAQKPGAHVSKHVSRLVRAKAGG